ncbi:hypothetical protein BFW38_02405 [Terasakiispira papahanaumokuakeensis]|uniref:CCA-adding enzyme n=1 Tax=Terasakiispira papahanaumokuakeensis TaxID=197479 RepID=A0A1E2VDP0_9GAMM|nr:hypothetical protein [Terasakiispira papahanaumokuakeensis]ODC05130.1 hypothetical protein BFW38_02405 [Terasakiispira papahanaumokuakeensis]
MKAYLVGGAVRDHLLGLPVTDRDWVVVGSTPEEMKAQGFVPVGQDFPVFLHPKTHEEYALARTERKSGKGYQGFTFYASPEVTLEDDLVRRDLTINAMAQDETGALVDPFHGQADLNGRWLRHVSPAFVEDPLRVLRVARFAARFAPQGFRVAPETLTMMQSIAASGELAHLTPERCWLELEKSLHTPCPAVFFQVLADAEALSVLWPELADFLHQSPNALVALNDCAASGAQVEQRWAQLWVGAEVSLLEATEQRLKTPNRYRELAALAARAWDHPGLKAHHAGEVLALFERLDAWRRPERADLFWSLLSDSPGLLQQAYEAAKGLSAKAFVEAGLKGPEVGRALAEARQEAIAQVIQSAVR